MPRLSRDEDLCIDCGLCVDNCPVKGIDLEADLPDCRTLASIVSAARISVRHRP